MPEQFSDISSVFVEAIGAVLVILFCAAYLSYVERKVLAAMQLRKGPNVVGPFGLLQPVADALKLLSKETIIPFGADIPLFIGAAIFAFSLALSAWVVVPFDDAGALANINVGVVYLFSALFLGVYGVVIGSWASSSKYSLIGGMRFAAQAISYNLIVGLVMVAVVLKAGSLNLNRIVDVQRDGWFLFSILFPLFAVFIIAMFAEMCRDPLGAEGEYSAVGLGLFSLGRNMNILLLSAMASLLFLGGWLPPFEFLDFVPGFIWLALKTVLCLFVLFWARATLPCYRHDQLMDICWKGLLPFSLLWVVLVAGYLTVAGGLPHA